MLDVCLVCQHLFITELLQTLKLKNAYCTRMTTLNELIYIYDHGISILFHNCIFVERTTVSRTRTFTPCIFSAGSSIIEFSDGHRNVPCWRVPLLSALSKVPEPEAGGGYLTNFIIAIRACIQEFTHLIDLVPEDHWHAVTKCLLRHWTEHQRIQPPIKRWHRR